MESPSKAIADFREKCNLCGQTFMARPGKFVAFQGKNDKELLARWKKSNYIKITKADIKYEIVYYYLLLLLQTQFC